MKTKFAKTWAFELNPNFERSDGLISDTIAFHRKIAHSITWKIWARSNGWISCYHSFKMLTWSYDATRPTLRARSIQLVHKNIY
jgi:hypothetical protein